MAVKDVRLRAVSAACAEDPRTGRTYLLLSGSSRWSSIAYASEP